MSVSVQFLLGALGILLFPGPTNTLLATAGALAGVSRSLRLILAVLAAYLIAIGVWYQILRPLVSTSPAAALFSKLLACAYLIYTVIRLYNPPPAENAAASAVSPRQLFIVTSTNPKAAVFALLVFDQTKLSPAEFIVFSALVPCVALIWIGLGRTFVTMGLVRNPLVISRIAAAILVVFVGLLLNSIFAAM